MTPAVLDQILETRAAQTWTALPGIVRSYNTSTQLAVVQPAVQDFSVDADGERTDRSLPEIPDVPVAWVGGAGQFFHPGLEAGDEVLIVISSLDPSIWHRTGSVSKAADLGRNVPAHAFAIPCVYSRGNGPADTGFRIAKGTVTGHLEADTAEVTNKLEAGQAEIGGSSDAAALASVLDALLTAIAASTPPPATEPGLLAVKTAMAAYVTSASSVLKVGS